MSNPVFFFRLPSFLKHVHRFLGVLFLSLFLCPSYGQQTVWYWEGESPCHSETWESQNQMSDLYCIPLSPTPELRGASGYAAMLPVMSPYGVDVDLQGHHRYHLEFAINGLPDPRELGNYTSYVAWATTPQFDPVVKLGVVTNGVALVGEVAFNMFTILISAESSPNVEERSGRLVLRGMSPSSKMEGHDLLQVAPLALINARQTEDIHHHGMHDSSGDQEWKMPPGHPNINMLPGMMHIRPNVKPFKLSDSLKKQLPEAGPRKRALLNPGDSITLSADIVRREIEGQTLVMYGFNKQYPGPLLEVEEDSEIVVNFENRVNLPSAIHWHGLRLDYQHDGVPGLTQELVPSGGNHRYLLSFPDPGIYWYHPHFREDIKMDLGLYSNILVRPEDPSYYNPVHREEVLVFDDILLDGRGGVPYGKESSNYMLMGRFGNTFLINGRDNYSLTLNEGEIVRFYLTNSSNTRTYNLSFGDKHLKLIGSDVGKFEREEWVQNIVIATAERYIVEAEFDSTGVFPILNRVQAIDHRNGFFFPEVDTLGFIHVQRASGPVGASRNLDTISFGPLREHKEVIADIDAVRSVFDKPVEKEIVVKLEVQDLPPVVQQLMRFDNVYFNPVEWSGTMPMMNWASTGEEVKWILEDPHTGKQNMEIDWQFEVGNLVKIKLTNERDAFHGMQHPIHIHGQRFLVLKRNGINNDNLVWKDTTILPAGSTVELLLEISNPGKWMVHCHIAEHIDSGMMFVFDATD